jgi:thiamine biosynthesis lipoprotein
MSTWIPTSIISRINNNEENVIVDDYFKVVLINLLKFLKNRREFWYYRGAIGKFWALDNDKKHLRQTKVDSYCISEL